MMDEKCNHWVGYTLNTRAEVYECYHKSDLDAGEVKESEISTKFNFCPNCGEKIDW